MSQRLLSIERLTVAFGGVIAVNGVDLTLSEGEILGLIGPNGAGKTTLLDAVSRLVPPRSGRILLDGVDLADRAPHDLAGLGVARTFQHLGLVGALSAAENVMLGAHRAARSGFVRTALGLGIRRREQELADRARQILARVGLEGVGDRPVAELPHGLRLRVELGRALASDPRLLLLDEPAAGLEPEGADELVRLLRNLRDDLGVGTLLVEHDVPLVMALADRVVALDGGQVLAAGPPHAVRRDPAVIASYLDAGP